MSKASRTKAFITEKTAALFNRKGYAGTSLTDMTEATGLTKGSIYGNFQDKDEVALEAFGHNMGKLVEQVRALQATERSASGKLKAFVSVYRNGLKSAVLADGCPIINTGTEADDTHPELKAKVKDALLRWHKSISAIIQQGKLQGEFKDDINSNDFASLMIAMIEGGFTLSKISGDASYLDQCLGHLDKLIDEKLRR